MFERSYGDVIFTHPRETKEQSRSGVREGWKTEDLMRRRRSRRRRLGELEEGLKDQEKN